MTKAKIKLLEEIVNADLSNGRHIQKKVRKLVHDTGQSCEAVAETLKTQKRKRSAIKETE